MYVCMYDTYMQTLITCEKCTFMFLCVQMKSGTVSGEVYIECSANCIILYLMHWFFMCAKGFGIRCVLVVIKYIQWHIIR